MKRDLILLFLCFCVLGGVSLLGREQVVPASGTAPEYDRVLILDAGHGGEDGGASSASGSRESDINLEIVLKAEALMGFLGVRTELTRSEDVSIYNAGASTLHEKKVSDLKNRVAMIQDIPNAMLISVHQNHFTDSRYSGAQVFYGEGDVGRQWGEYAQEVLRQTLNPDNGRSAKLVPNGIYLFEHINCPFLLVECGFLSNGEESSLLLTGSYQRKIAMALAGAYFHEVQMLPTVWGGD